VASQTVSLLVELTIPAGNVDMFNSIAQQMVAGTQTEPGALAYEWYVSSDGQRCRLLETYRDAAALLVHFKGPVVQQLVPKLAEQVKIDRFEIYGDPGAEVAAMVTGFGTEIFAHRYGLDR